jgi:hypothetical protein
MQEYSAHMPIKSMVHVHVGNCIPNYYTFGENTLVMKIEGS